jgi:uncharacterized protein (TIGR02118 family)
MVKVSVLYPNATGSKFNMDYYLDSHIPMVRGKLGSACKSVEVEQGIAGGSPGAPAPFAALCHLYFDSVEAFQKAFAPHSQAIMADFANYTNVQPTIQISEIRL